MNDLDKKTDLDSRMRGFNTEILPLLKKYRFGLGGEAFITPDGRIAARSILVDDTRVDKEKNIIAEA